MRPGTTAPVWSALLVAILLPVPASQASPDDLMKAGGFTPTTVQEGDASGAVNVLNGSLTLSYPIGPAFQVNEAVSYQLLLNYSSENHRWQRVQADYLRGRSPVAYGWTMHFGRIAEDPDIDNAGPDPDMAYQSADGVWHKLTFANPASSLCTGYSASPYRCYVTRDSTFIRAVRVDDGIHDYWLVWTPDGVERELRRFVDKTWACSEVPLDVQEPRAPSWGCQQMDDFYGWYTTTMWDPLGNPETDPDTSAKVTVEYEDPVGPVRHCMKRVYDSVRTAANPTIEFFNTVVVGQNGSIGGLTNAIRVQTADGLATYQLDNLDHWFQPNYSSCQFVVPNWSKIDVNLLDSITLDTGTGTPLVTHFTWGVNGSNNRHVAEVDLPDGLARAQYDWLCQWYSAGKVPFSTPCESETIDKLMVVEKKVLRGNGTACTDPDVDCWTYDRELFSPDRPLYAPCGIPELDGCPPPTNPNKVVVTLPATTNAAGGSTRNQRIHYFNTGYDACVGCPAPNNFKNGLEREVEYRTAGNLTQRVLTDYATDPYPWTCLPIPRRDGPANVRVVKTRTEFGTEAGCGSSVPPVRYYEKAKDLTNPLYYDGFGHYRVEIETTNDGGSHIPASPPLGRRTETWYTHEAQDFAEWFLGRMVKQEVYNAATATNLQFRHLFNWDSYGRLWREYREGLGSVADVTVHHGWVGHERRCEAWSGGDSPAIPAPDFATVPEKDGLQRVDCTDVELGCDSSDKTVNKAYAIEQEYAQGAVIRRAFKGIGHNLERFERSLTSGAVLVEHDPDDQYARRRLHDLAGRVTRIQFEDDETEVETAVDLTWDSATQVHWNRGLGPSGHVKYDAYGRTRQTRIEDPDGTAQDLVKVTETDVLGNLTCDGNWFETLAWDPITCSGREFRGHDVLGRPAKMIEDGLEKLAWAYCGNRTIETRRVWNGTGETDVFGVTRRDGFGRLAKVEDPWGDGIPTRVALYSYDALDRLINVNVDGQTRAFIYDGHGNLRSATEPESGLTIYSNYDARGNLRTSKTDADDVEIQREYDCGGRLIDEWVIGGDEYRHYQYDDGAPGKMTLAESGNAGGDVVAHEYEFSGLMGRLEYTTTTVLGKTFEQRQTYNELGLPSLLEYPSSPSDRDPSRPVLSPASVYEEGFLDTVTDSTTGQEFVLNVEYHQTGGPLRIELGHRDYPAKRLYVYREYEPNGRIDRIRLRNETSTALFDTGNYVYDRSGNIMVIGTDDFAYFRDSTIRDAKIGPRPPMARLFDAHYEYTGFGSLKSRNSDTWNVSNSTNRIALTSGYDYWPAGNLKHDLMREYTWDGFNRLVQVDDRSVPPEPLAVSLYDAAGERIQRTTWGSCASDGDRTYSIRDSGGRVLSEFSEGGVGDECNGELTWLRDYVYAGADRIGVVSIGEIAAPQIGETFACEDRIDLYFGEPDWHECRTQGVNFYRRPVATPTYDFTSPVNTSPVLAACADGEDSRLWSDTPPSGTNCYVARSVDLSGELGPESAEICRTTSSDGCPDLLQWPNCGPASPMSRSFQYYVTDHLGTPRMTVTDAGEEVETLQLGPYGEIIDDASCAQVPQFTGHERDRETGLDYMHARYYEQGKGRFQSVDPRGNHDAANPLGWNKYAYANDNPLVLVDPDGLAAYRIVVSHPGQTSNVGRNFERAAATRKAELEKRGDTATIVKAESATEFEGALETGPLIDGGLIYYGHGTEITDQSDQSHSALSFHPRVDPAVNLSWYNVGQLSNANLGPNATVELYSCHAAAGGSSSIANGLAQQLQRSVTGYSGTTRFSSAPDGSDKSDPPPEQGPLYQVGEGNGEWVTFRPYIGK